jgi:hypothetical protein
MIGQCIDEILTDYQAVHKNNKSALADLRLYLKANGQGATLVENHKLFKGINILEGNQKFQRLTIKTVLEIIEGTGLDKDKLGEKYKDFTAKYTDIVEKCLMPKYDGNGDPLPIDYTPVVTNITSTFSNSRARAWKSKHLANIPDLLASIFALWTLMNSEHYS